MLFYTFDFYFLLLLYPCGFLNKAPQEVIAAPPCSWLPPGGSFYAVCKDVDPLLMLLFQQHYLIIGCPCSMKSSSCHRLDPLGCNISIL